MRLHSFSDTSDRVLRPTRKLVYSGRGLSHGDELLHVGIEHVRITASSSTYRS
jgi:hypothetical protein